MRNIESSLGVTAQRSGSATTFFLRDPNGTILSSRTGSTRVNYVSEASGHVVWLVAPDGTQVGGYKYAPYGKTAAYGSAAQTNRFRWLGAQQNITSSGTDGHYKLGARYYDLQGHFTQPDPLSGGMSDPRTLTGYNYAGGDPINRADASGYLSLNFDIPFLCTPAGFGCLSVTGSTDGNSLTSLGLGGSLSSARQSSGFSISSGTPSGFSLGATCNRGPVATTFDFLSGGLSTSLVPSVGNPCSVGTGYSYAF
ncbi:MAG: hypothetical protein PGN15_15720 [Aeromicrobium erythreum]